MLPSPIIAVEGLSVSYSQGAGFTRVVEHKGHVLYEQTAEVPSESDRAIDARNAYLMGSLLQEITRSGTAARAQATLKRPDLYGKTGTTNDSVDAWFVGFQPTVVAAAWEAKALVNQRSNWIAGIFAIA